MTEDALDEGDAAHEEHHDEGKVGAGEAGQVAEKHGNSTPSSELVAAFGREGHPDGDTKAHCNGGNGNIENSWTRYR